MEEKLGFRKIVYKDGSYTKAISGECFLEEPFIRVETSHGEVYVNKDAIIVIKHYSRDD